MGISILNTYSYDIIITRSVASIQLSCVLFRQCVLFSDMLVAILFLYHLGHLWHSHVQLCIGELIFP